MKVEYKKRGMFNYSPLEKRKWPFVAIILLYPVVHVALFYLYVHLDAILIAFKDTKGNWSFESFSRVFQGFFAGCEPVSGINLAEYLLKSLLIWLNMNTICEVFSLVTVFMLPGFFTVCRDS